MTVQQHQKGTTGRTRAAGRGRVLGDLPRQRPASDGDGPEVPGRRWVARPVVARLIQLVVLAVPIAASLVVALVLSAVLPHSTDLGSALWWWAVVVAGSTLTLFAVDRVARRLLPLAVLLRLSLLFPDQAPRRFRVAAQSWSSKRLREKVEMARLAGQSSAPVVAATQIIGLLASLAVHDRRTRGHCERVRAYNDLLAEELGLSEGDRDRLRWAALIHDIGKLKVSPRLLNKPGAPTRDEWTVLRAHPSRGAEIAAPLSGWLGPWGAAIEQHHERWDGAGYPHGLRGMEISLGARIVAVADAFEVMTSTRPYSRPVDAAKARTELAECAGSHFDPVVVRAFLNISLGRLRKVMGPVAWVAQVPFLAGMPRLEAAIIGGGRQAAVGAGAAGAAASVVAATTLAPPHAQAHHHVTVAVPAAETSQAPATGAPAAGSAAATPVLPQAVTTQHHHGATARAEAEAKTKHAAAGRETARRAGHANSNAHSRVASHTHATLPVNDPDVPGNDISTARSSGGAHGRSGAHRHNGGHGKVDAEVVSDESASDAIATHGRCAGNHGGGLGNGGPADGSAPNHPLAAGGPPADARGLAGCD